MIEAGEYVRTKRGIAKVLEVKTVQPKMYGKHDVVYLIDKCPRMYISDAEFIKHSKNIIDLIEASDYVNGILIEDIEEIDNKKVFYSNGEMIAWTNRDKGIETILTKEQYIQNCYKIDTN